MRTTNNPTHPFTSIDNSSLDKKPFNPSKDDIQHLCQFFSLGGLRHFEKEKGISFYHANFFVFVSTTRGQYALKFYPPDTVQKITIEFAINRVLTDQHFLTPLMHAGINGQAFSPSNDRLATCYSYVNGHHALKHIRKPGTTRQINAAMLSLKNILSTNKKLKNILNLIPTVKERSMTSTIHSLAQDFRLLTPYEHKKIVDTALLDACQTYQHHRHLFTRQWQHHDAILNNFLIYKKTVYTLDMENVWEDYILCDLASLVISCLFRSIPVKTIKTIVKDYFTQHNIGSEGLIVLHALLKIKIISEYLRNIKYEKNLKLSVPSPGLAHTYMPHLLAYKKIAAPLLKGMNNISGLIGTDG